MKTGTDQDEGPLQATMIHSNRRPMHHRLYRMPIQGKLPPLADSLSINLNFIWKSLTSTWAERIGSINMSQSPCTVSAPADGGANVYVTGM
jgi:hypothetical protein